MGDAQNKMARNVILRAWESKDLQNGSCSQLAIRSRLVTLYDPAGDSTQACCQQVSGFWVHELFAGEPSSVGSSPLSDALHHRVDHYR